MSKEENIFSPLETIINTIRLKSIDWNKDIGKFYGKVNGLSVEVAGSHIQRRSGGGIMSQIMGEENKVIEDRWVYSLRIATSKNQSYLEGLRYSSDDCQLHHALLEDLFWHVTEKFQEQGEAKVLSLLNNHGR